MNSAHNINKTALITGASSGIGKSVAHELAKKGYDLLLLGRNELSLSQTSYECSMYSSCTVTTYCIDLSDENEVRIFLAWLEKHPIEIEVLVNNAGFGELSQFILSDITTELKMINVHINAPIMLIKHILPQMAERKKGYIMNVSSIYAFASVPYQSVYGATKSFLNSFSFALREELKDSGVSITTVCPGSTRTNFRRFLSIEPEKAKGMDATIVAMQACKDLFERKTVSIPGWINHFYFYLMWFFPATYLAGIVRLINHKRGMNHPS